MFIWIGFFMRILLYRRRSINKLVSPEPVPPEKEQLTITPFKLSQAYSIFNIFCSHLSTIYFPKV